MSSARKSLTEVRGRGGISASGLLFARLIDLEPFEHSDFARLISWLDSAEALFAWTGAKFSHPLDAEQLERHLADQVGPEAGILKAIASEGGEHVGHIEYCVIDRDQRAATLCRLLVAPERRGSGIGAAIMRAAVERAFQELGLHRVELRAFEDSGSVIRLHQRVGFVREGTLRDARYFQGEYRSQVVMSILEDEWRAAGARGSSP
jgi:RimJ/RimL family protein N-acetyltransferase